ncbi:MAG: ferredoxin--nitrite reductase [Thiovulaceae bacterium]|nr:ferredoxin--nitrite reductase [Sulfurimonadaceae bacterium]
MKTLQTAFDARNKKQNKIEGVKALKIPQDALDQLETYANEGYDSIPAEDKNYFLKCFGLFDKGEKFMIRVRIPGGQLNNEQAIALGEIARDYGEDYIDITTRMQIELRNIKIQDVPTIFKKFSSVGISSYQTGVDNFRNILNDPLDEMGMDTILPSQKLLESLQDKFLYKAEWISALPRKFNTAISGSMVNRNNVFGQDCCFVLAQKDGVYGYNLYLGGKVGQIAKSADMFLASQSEVEAAFGALIELFRDYGYRDNRNKNRLYFLIQDVGMEVLTQAIRDKAGIDFAHAGLTMTQMDNRDSEQGRAQLRDGSFAVHAVIPSGMFSGSGMLMAATAAKSHGDGRIRLDVEQSLYLLGVTNEKMSALLEEPFFQEFKNINTPYFNHMIACAGTQHCSFGVIPNKPDAIEMSEYLSKAVPLEAGHLRMYWSACVKGCGIHEVGDIGFEGCKAKVDGETVYAAHISIGGKLIGEGKNGYVVVKAAPLTVAKYYVESLALEYRRLKLPQETFEKFHDRVLADYSHAAIGFIMRLLAYARSKNIDLAIGFDPKVETGRHEAFEIFDLGTHLYYQLIGIKPYNAVGHFAPTSHASLQELTKTVPSLDKNLAKMVYKMIEPDNRALVFSELQEFLLIQG